jgi:xylulokinase
MTLNHSGGLLLRWFRDTLSEAAVQRARSEGRDPYDVILADAPEGPTGLLVMPHFAGKGTPGFDTSSRGAIAGLTFATTHADIAKGILEGLTFELRANIDLLREAGAAIEELHAVGGGARSPLWLQLKADICQVPLRVPRVTEAACLGAALLAGVGCGVYKDVWEAVGQTVHFDRRVEPRPASAHAYDRVYDVYEDLYPALISLQRRLP